MTPPVMRSPSLLGPLGVPLPIRTSTPHRSPARKPALNALPISSVALLPQSASLSWLLPLVFAGLMAVTLRVVAHSRCTLPPMLRKPPSIPNVHSIWTAVEAAGHGSTVCVVDEHHGKPAFQATFSEMRHLIETAAAALQGIGVQHGSMVAVFSENSHRWLVVDHAVSMCGGVSAVRGAGAPVEELVYILQNSEATFLVVENSALLRQLVGAMPAEQFASLRAVVVLYEKDPAALRDVEGAMQAAAGEGAERLRVLGFEEVVSQGKAQQFMPVTVLPSDLVTLVYTSGTTGKPKGAMLTHANLLTQAVLNSFHLLASPNTHDPRPGDIYLSILPCWHVFERAAECFMLYHGATLVYTTKLRFKSDMLKHRPHYLIAVPRIFDVVHSGVQQKLKAKPAVVQRVIGFLTAAAKRHHTARRTFTNMDLSTRIRFPDGPGLLRRAAALLTMALTYPLARLADLLVFQKVREAIGGRVKVACSGGASLPMHLDEFYDIVGLKVLVGYGLTETSPTVACRSVDHNMIGTCGFAAFSELRVVDEETGKPVPPLTSGLVQAKGPQVFSGYYHNPEATAKAFTEDGFFDTGDSGFLLRTGELVLSGRVKDIIVLSNGENIEPSPIEDAITASPLVDQVMLVGQGQRGLGALVVPNMPELRGRGLITASDLTQYEGLVAANDVAALGEFAHRLESQLALWKALHREINAHVHGRVGYRPDEQIIDFRLVLTPFSIENQQLTQTLKVRRNVVEHDFEHLIAAMFARPEV
eukprot:GGOE01014689.1.p1 GENE.GGOE01014689.1~~GGOE01014689.1.p1  ORF type:complete len:835 (-),score=229.81 GGOE01014689.1:90-2363(-)